MYLVINTDTFDIDIVKTEKEALEEFESAVHRSVEYGINDHSIILAKIEKQVNKDSIVKAVLGK